VISREVLKQVRRIEIATRGLVDELFSGEYHSAFKGRGMSFAEVREYLHGDDIRSLDWNVTARSGTPHVKIFEEERELTVLLVADLSRSGEFGTRTRFKKELAVELCALLAFSAIRNNDKVGLILFTDRIEKFVPPRKGRRHVLRVVRELLYHQPEGIGTDIGGALDYLARVQKRRATVFLVSDLMGEGYRRSMAVTARRHDLVAVRIGDSRERQFPKVGFLELEDAETGARMLVNTSGRSFRERLRREIEARGVELAKTLRRSGVDLIEIDTHEGCVRPLMRFFQERMKRRRSK